jgi:integrase
MTISVEKTASQSPAVRIFLASLRHLAAAHGSTPECLALTPEIEADYRERLGDYLTAQGKHLTKVGQPSSAIRNARQEVGQFLRMYHERPAAPPPPPAPPRLKSVRIRGSRTMHLEMQRTSPYRERYSQLTPYLYPEEGWPASVHEGWQRFCETRGIDIRPVTLKTYHSRLVVYMSYNLRFDRVPLTSWDDLFDLARLLRFVSWHAQRVGVKRISATGRQVFRVVTMLARHDGRPEYAGLLARERKLPVVEPMHDKQASEHTISATELEQIGLRLLREADEPLRGFWKPSERYGLQRAGRRRDALLLRLMWRIPMRSRCIREMALHRNLFKTPDGQWILRYRGDELKVGARGGRINEFRVPFPPELVSHLEDYLERSRPIFPNADTSPLVFLTQKGRQFTPNTLRNLLCDTVYLYTGKRVYPHLLRTLWVDQYLLKTDGDISTAAFWLNDNVMTVLKRYHELRGSDHTQKAYAFNREILAGAGG